MMKQYIFILSAILLIACGTNTNSVNESGFEVQNEEESRTEEYVEVLFEEERDNNSIRQLNEILNGFAELEGYSVYALYKTFHIEGDFFGDNIQDIAVLVKKEGAEEVKLCIINYGKQTNVYLFGLEDDPFDMSDYRWVGIFRKVDKGEVLWSNYEDDWRGFEDVPENEKVILDYDAIYVHAAESCGGGFIFWKEGKFHWLQQE